VSLGNPYILIVAGVCELNYRPLARWLCHFPTH